ncbi:hypothetical protein KM915_25825 [Cytobacillus oceanisediminis]|uniref:hypothetical protein n=1 Tax=Cytobacillus oceanisediminis TaxID=665099 RepID=UPI001C233A0A|nr:hypothetical protein [Cytobacillus oceanisediminis]MBU8733435.1 hypothetical protein [Cytobacillus oceanisediminis]
MARNMTTVQNSSTIRFGSAKFEVGETEETLVDLGAMRGIAFEESWDERQIMSDNAGVISAGISNHTATISGDLMEINLDNLHILRGGIDKLVDVPADQTAGTKAAKKLLSGGVSTFKPRVVKITNYNDKGEAFSITIFKANSASGLNITFPEADGEDPAMTPIEMTGTLDTSKAVGEQLFEIYDEQGIVPTV